MAAARRRSEETDVIFVGQFKRDPAIIDQAAMDVGQLIASSFPVARPFVR
jgi:hypothetical protein